MERKVKLTSLSNSDGSDVSANEDDESNGHGKEAAKKPQNWKIMFCS
jgi:hypothetical protein